MTNLQKLFRVGIVGLLAFFITACQSDKPKKIEYNPAFDAYLSAFTEGEISKKASILVRFAEDVVKNKNSAVDKTLIQFEPALKGEAVWRDSRTLEFLPAQDLQSGKIYSAKVNMQKLFKNIDNQLASFSFQFRAKEQHINVSPLAARAQEADGKKWMQLHGKVETNDIEDAAEVEKILKASMGSENLTITWNHKNGHEHHFTIDKVARNSNPYAVKVTWNGEDIASNSKGSLDFNVPGANEFNYNHYYRYNSPEQHIILEFTDLLDPYQDLNGLITVDGKPMKYSIDHNLVKVYPGQKLLGKFKLEIAADIKNLSGKTLNSPATETVTFSDAIPAIEFIGKGNIIPRSNKMPVIFKTINLHAIDVRVIKIKEDNIQQFFQVNQIGGDSELKRVGTVVLEKRIDLDKTKGLDLSEWTNHSLELASLIEPEAGAIYEIALGFRQSYTLNQCPTPEPETDEEGNPLPMVEREEIEMLKVPADWDKPTYEYSYWDWYEYDYQYSERDNPCKPYFYTTARVAKRNILASDLGILAKQGDNGNLFVVNNLQTTEPMAGVVLEFYDYHQDLITSIKTDKNGMAKVELAKTAFMLVAKSGAQRGYLRLDDGSALSMSRFDVSGTTSVKGLKGFVYGERGVWRPGDDMFINFILEDKNKALPAGHPVKFELKDPRGAVVVRKTSTEGVHGVYNFTCQTEETASTGNYTAIVRVGAATFSKTIKIETIKPNRLKMALDFGTKEIDAGSGAISGTLNAKWLHGAIAKNLKAKVEMSLKNGITTFKQFPDYNFTDPVNKVDGENQTIFDGTLNAEGNASIPFKMPKKFYAPGIVNAVFRTQVFEQGGDFSIDQMSIPVHPYKSYVGVRLPSGDNKRNMLLTDQKHKVEIATVDKTGKAVSKSNLDVKVYKLEWRWWFDQNKNEVSGYQGRVSAAEVAKGTVSTGANGVGVYEMEVKYPEWGRYLVRACDGDGHCSGQVFYIDWPGWAGKSREGDSEGATALNFTSDKEKYNVGEEVTLNIPTGYSGRALVTIESGSKVLDAQWVNAAQGTTQYKFKTTSAMAPNVYAYVTLLQPHAQTKNDLPIRMYGVLPISVEDPKTHLEPVLTMSDELKPMQDFTVAVSEKKGGPMTYTLAIVDEGLLDLTRFKTPSPWEEFYQREALGVKTWDMYNSVLGAFGGEVKSLLSIGGDDAILNNKQKKNDRFKPVVLYVGPFHLPAGQTQKHNFTMPNYVGSVRVMVVAAEEAAYGATEKAVPVRQPLMVLGTLPRVLGPGETIKLPVTVFAMKEGIKDVNVTISGSEMIEVVGANSRTVSFKEIGDEMTYFELKVKDRAGTGNVKIAVSGGGHSASYETDIEIRLPNPRISEAYAGVVEAGKTWEQGYKPLGIVGTNNGVLEVSSVPPLNLGKRLRYLIQYPYGCVEQTTSSVFPQVFLAKLMDLPKETKDKIDANIKAGIKRLQSFQVASGGLGYWQGATEVNDWATNYAGHFMLEAESAGYEVPKEFKKNWLEYQKSKANSWASTNKADDDLTQAYRLYLLALAGKAELGAMNRMRLKALHRDAVAARWHLAAAYHLAGQKKVAEELSNGAVLDVLEYAKGLGAPTFGSRLRDQALILQSLSIMNQRAKADMLVKMISQRLASDQWLNTQETSQALVAMAKFVGEGGVSNSVEFEYRLAGGSWTKVKSDKPLWQLDLNGEASNKIEIKNAMGQAIFARVVADGIPAAADETDASNGMSITVAYMTLEEKTLDITNLKQGEEFLAAVTITNKGGYTYNEVALNQIFPSGWEIINHRLMGIKLPGAVPEYQDIRDDRVYTFFDLAAGKSQVFYVRLNAAYLGRYYLPAVSVEAMYDKSLNARKKGQWVEVIAQSGK